MCTRAPTDTYTPTKARRHAGLLRKLKCAIESFFAHCMEQSLKSSRVPTGQGIRLRSLRGTQLRIRGLPPGTAIHARARLIGPGKATSAAQPTSEGLVVPGRQKSGIFTHSARSVKQEGVRGKVGGVVVAFAPFISLGSPNVPASHLGCIKAMCVPLSFLASSGMPPLP